MTAESVVLNEAQMKALYGKFYKKSHKMKFNLADVPKKLHALVPYARFWGVESGEYEDLVDTAPREVLANLPAAVESFNDELDEWLGGPEAEADEPTLAYIAFTVLRMSSDYANVLLDEDAEGDDEDEDYDDEEDED
jgi:hypothetical protein